MLWSHCKFFGSSAFQKNLQRLDQPTLVFFFCIFEKNYNDWIKSFSKSKWTGLRQRRKNNLLWGCTADKQPKILSEKLRIHQYFDHIVRKRDVTLHFSWPDNPFALRLIYFHETCWWCGNMISCFYRVFKVMLQYLKLMQFGMLSG